MFCTKCGKEIDNNSTFCPYCGQKIDAPVENRSSMKKKKVSVKMLSKKVIGGIAAVVVVFLVVFGISQITAGISNKSKSMAEKIFEMPIEDMVKWSEDDFKDMLDDEGILYKDYMGFGITASRIDSFKGYDCAFGYTDRPVGCSNMGNPPWWIGDNSSNFVVAFDTKEDFKEGQKTIEKYLEKNRVDKSPVLKVYTDAYNYTSDIYLVECSDSLEEINQDEKNYKIYKFVQIYYPEMSDYQNIFPDDKTYTDYVCKMQIRYWSMTEEEYISYTGNLGYDIISHEEIDVEKFKESVDEDMVKPYLNYWKKLNEEGLTDEYFGYMTITNDERRVYEEQLYRRLYMMEKHNFDIHKEVMAYFKTDEEKKMWYIDYFNWDIDTGTKIDVSD